MPFCRLCRSRIDVSKTGVNAYRCRKCGKMFCKSHFSLEKNICLECAGYSAKEIATHTKRFASFTQPAK